MSDMPEHENHDEIRWTAELFPQSRDYLGVYEHFGLVRPGSLYAHCIHFDAPTWKRFADAGAIAVHCPTSNLFLGSGLFNYAAARDAGAGVALATDVGGGTSFSMLRTMHEAHKAEILAKYDTDKDGKLSDEERAAMAKDKAAEHFAKLDTTIACAGATTPAFN